MAFAETQTTAQRTPHAPLLLSLPQFDEEVISGANSLVVLRTLHSATGGASDVRKVAPPICSGHPRYISPRPIRIAGGCYVAPRDIAPGGDTISAPLP